MPIGELITVIFTSGVSIMTTWTDVATEFIKLPVDLWSTIFNAVTG